MLRMIFAVSIFALAAQSQAADQKPSTFVLCKNQKDVRSLRVEPAKEGCKATYSKGGKDEVVGQDQKNANCKSILAKIQDTLESSKYKCREVGSAIVTTSEVVR